MKIYRVHIRNASGRSVEYRYFANKSEAKTYLAKNTAKIALRDEDFEAIGFQPTRNGLLSLLNLHASHPDNG